MTLPCAAATPDVRSRHLSFTRTVKKRSLASRREMLRSVATPPLFLYPAPTSFASLLSDPFGGAFSLSATTTHHYMHKQRARRRTHGRADARVSFVLQSCIPTSHDHITKSQSDPPKPFIQYPKFWQVRVRYPSLLFCGTDLLSVLFEPEFEVDNSRAPGQ